MQRKNLSGLQIRGIVKSILWITAGILILIFMELWERNLKFLVGTAILVYGLESIVLYFTLYRKKGRSQSLYWGLVELVLALVLMLGVESAVDGEKGYIVVCVVWAIWALLREGLEMEEAVHGLLHRKSGVLELAVGITSIVFSCMLVLDPGEHHATTHIYLLAVELWGTSFLYPLERFLVERFANKHSWRLSWFNAVHPGEYDIEK